MKHQTNWWMTWRLSTEQRYDKTLLFFDGEPWRPGHLKMFCPQPPTLISLVFPPSFHPVSFVKLRLVLGVRVLHSDAPWEDGGHVVPNPLVFSLLFSLLLHFSQLDACNKKNNKKQTMRHLRFWLKIMATKKIFAYSGRDVFIFHLSVYKTHSDYTNTRWMAFSAKKMQWEQRTEGLLKKLELRC